MHTIFDINDTALSAISPKIPIEFPQIIDAYFAKIRKEGGEKQATVQKGEGLIALAKRLGTTQEKLKEMNVGKLKTWGSVQGFNADETITYEDEEGGSKVYFDKVGSKNIGQDVYLVVKTKHFQGRKIQLNIHQGKEKVIAEKDKLINITQNGKSVSLIESIVGEFDEISNAENKDDFKDWAISKLTLKPSSDEQLKQWKDALEATTGKKTLLYLLVDAHSANTDYDKKRIVYYGRNPDEDGNPDKNTIRNYWLDMEKKWFELKLNKCYCNRDLTVEEVKKLVDKDKLFDHKKCPLPATVKTYEEFTKQLNATFNNYDINTCLRKAHFIAQTEAESDHYKTTVEYASGSAYEGRDDLGNKNTGDGKKFKGRGLIQLTGRTNYTDYSSHVGKSELVNKPEKIGEDIFYSFDSAGWYWNHGSAWGNMNPKADKDDLIAVSIGINGGLNGYAHRKKNLKRILGIMKVKDECDSLKLEQIGVYKYGTSNIKNSKYGKKNKAAIQKFDD